MTSSTAKKARCMECTAVLSALPHGSHVAQPRYPIRTTRSLCRARRTGQRDRQHGNLISFFSNQLFGIPRDSTPVSLGAGSSRPSFSSSCAVCARRAGEREVHAPDPPGLIPAVSPVSRSPNWLSRRFSLFFLSLGWVKHREHLLQRCSLQRWFDRSVIALQCCAD